jgi:hypothetical protein
VRAAKGKRKGTLPQIVRVGDKGFRLLLQVSEGTIDDNACEQDTKSCNWRHHGLVRPLFIPCS